MSDLSNLLEDLRASLQTERVYPIGTIRHWKSGAVQKQSDGSWKPRQNLSIGLHGIHPESAKHFKVPPMRTPHEQVSKLLRTPIVPRIPHRMGDGHQIRDPRLLHRVEKDIESLHIEEAHIFDNTGHLVHQIRGNESSVRIPDVPMDHMTLTHNHPLGLSLSVDDLQLAVYKNLAEIRAVAREHDGVYVHRLLRPAEGWPSMDRVNQVMQAAEQRHMKQTLHDNIVPLIDPLLPDRVTGRPGLMTFREADRKYTEEFLAAHAYLLKIPYTTERVA